MVRVHGPGYTISKHHDPSPKEILTQTVDVLCLDETGSCLCGSHFGAEPRGRDAFWREDEGCRRRVICGPDASGGRLPFECQ